MYCKGTHFTRSSKTFGDKVRLLSTDTYSFFLQFYVNDLAREINSRSQLRDAFDFSEIEHTHLLHLHGKTDDAYGGEVGYFKDETNGDPIVEFIGLRPKMFSFTVCRTTEYKQKLNYKVEMRNKQVAKNISRSQIKRSKHKDYFLMYNGGALQNNVNRRIGFKLHQVRKTIFVCTH